MRGQPKPPPFYLSRGRGYPAVYVEKERVTFRKRGRSGMRYKRLFLQDIGGIPAAGGRRTKRGLLYRSGELYRLHAADLEALRNLSLAQVFDLREAETAARRPDGIDVSLTHRFPVRMGAFENLNLKDALRRKVDWSRYNFRRLYVSILEQNRNFIRRFLELLAEGPHPALVHCTAGKDRTGVFIAVLLLALGVSREQVLRWYRSIEPHLKRNTPRRVRLLAWYSGIPRETLMLNLPAMEALFAWLDARGGIESYLAEAGFDGVERLRSLFLE